MSTDKKFQAGAVLLNFLFVFFLAALAARAQSPQQPGPKRPPFEESDANKDGKITLDEMKAAHEAKITDQFKRMDHNSDGSITKSEYEEPMTPFSFASMDSNGDGNVSQDEFNKAMEQQRKAMKEQYR